MTRRFSMLRAVVAAVTAAGGLGLSSCAWGPPAARGAVGEGGLNVVASFYPLAFAAESIGGSRVRVTNLTKQGAEPHDLELTPSDVATVADAGLVVFERGLAPAVDDAASQQAAPGHALDVSTAAELNLRYTALRGAGGAPGATVDPHFWLDPLRYRSAAAAIATALQRLDPPGANTYRGNATAFEGRLTRLDAAMRHGLAHCARTEIVTSHNAFGYLAQRYGLTQVGITGLNPDAEPDPGALARVSDFVRHHGVTTVYAETLVSPAIADTVARETGATVATLDPIEGLPSSSAGRDYFTVMGANLATLRTGQGCT